MMQINLSTFRPPRQDWVKFRVQRLLFQVLEIGLYFLVVFQSLPDTLVMPNNPTSTLGGNALKQKSNFTRVNHEVNLYFRVECNNKFFTFSTPNGTLKTFNGLDYIPIFTWLSNLPPTARTRDRQCNAAIVRRSNRIKIPSLKVRDSNDNIGATNTPPV